MIEIQNLTFGYRKGEPIFDRLTASFSAQSIAIMGKSGAGKSTLLQLLQGRLRPETGKIKVLGYNLADFRSYTKISAFRREHLGIVPQIPTFIDELDAQTNVAISAAISGTPMDKAMRQARTMLLKCGVDPTQPVPTLSGGERGRVAVCRSLITEPELILADEPSAALDVPTARNIVQLLLKSPKAKSVLLVTHDEMIANMCELVVNLDEIISHKQNS
ncbi:ABC transporter ATP-binding protein [Arcanobacterium hippocoleae]|uniref:ABC transport system ATP-binding protein n=1 Tax=Arcanobacterium hippocoleae TaxID=149017 RepID=A0ABU1T296_9ACTO|nr:ABC transporter ATP-binding protein [Arcanobacterium hippocoleae]MDR6939507.1 putative ABC transport system ATP-binding protein [Arcanobacterium hippocoleae]